MTLPEARKRLAELGLTLVLTDRRSFYTDRIKDWTAAVYGCPEDVGRRAAIAHILRYTRADAVAVLVEAMESRRRNCPTCKGTGVVGVADFEGDEQAATQSACPWCGGGE